MCAWGKGLVLGLGLGRGSGDRWVYDGDGIVEGAVGGWVWREETGDEGEGVVVGEWGLGLTIIVVGVWWGGW